MQTFDELSTRWQLRPIRNCPGRFVLHTGPIELSPRELLESEIEIDAFKVSSVRDTVLVARIDGGGLISYRRADGTHLHTLNTVAGFERKLRDLGIKECVSEPGADRAPRAGSPRGVLDATGSKIQPPH